MDASHLPVLSLWAAADTRSDDGPARGVPPKMVVVDGIADSPQAALAIAVERHADRDVLLMHADARLGVDGWRRLEAAWRDGDWDVLSPADGFWIDRLGQDEDALAWTHGEHASFASAAWNATCSLWRGAAAERLCASATAPLRPGVLPCVAVARPVSRAEMDALEARDVDGRGDWLADAFHRVDPAPPALDLLQGSAGERGEPRPVPAREEVVLHVLHCWGGGAERFVRDLIAGDGERAHLVLVAHNDDDRPPLGTRLALYHDLDAPPLRTWALNAPIVDTAEHSPEVQAILAALLPEWGIGAVLVSSLIGHSLDVLRTGLPTAVCTHDAYPLWPLLHDERDPRREPFDGETLAAGLAATPDTLFKGRDAAGWRRLRDAWLDALDSAGARLVAPSAFACERLCAIEPELRDHDWKIVPHGLAPFPPADPPPSPRPSDAPLRVLVPGRLHGGKGERLLAALLPGLPADVELVLLGCGHAGAKFEGTPRLRVIPDYARDELPVWISRLQPDLALLPSTVPETFSYTLSEMQALGVPVLCAAPGAPRERLRFGGGLAVATDAGAVNAELARLAADRRALADLRPAEIPQPDLEAMADTWRLLLPVAPVPLHLPPADAASLRQLATTIALRTASHELQRHAHALGTAQKDLDGRALWALDLQRQIDAAVAELAGAQRELDSRAAWAQDLQRQIEQARLQSAADRDEIARRDEHLATLQRQLDQNIAAVAATATLRDRAIADAGTISELLRQLAAKDDAVRAMAAAEAEAETALAEAQSALADARRRLLFAAADAEELARVEAQVLDLEGRLKEAHGYYEADTADLARQRDVALAQRDQAMAELAPLQEAAARRARGWPRRLADGTGDRLAGAAYRLRRLRELCARGLASLRTRGIGGTWQRLRERRQPPAPATPPPVALAKPTVGVDLDTLRLPQSPTPRASIVVPVYNQLPYTLACLRAIADCGDATTFEVIVVDDGSTDTSPRVLANVSGVRYHRNPQNLGFVGACNAGAAIARGDFLVFLNNDTTVTPGWLDALLRTFADHPDTGLAGSKLVYPDGRLQEAGGIVFADGSGWNYGRFDDPAHPRYNFVREVDYCSGAAIALRRELFVQLQGFDPQYAPAYYEDTDLAMRIREHGLKVRYQPASMVIHHEGVTAGTDTRTGVKAYQVANQAKFVARWADTLKASHRRPGNPPEIAADRGRRSGRRVLVLDACTPTPDRDSGSLRMTALMRLLRDEGCSVVFFAENRAHDGRYTEALQALGVEVWWHPWLADVPTWLEHHGGGFDLVIGSRHYVLSPLLPLLRRHAERAFIVFDTVDLHHLREEREAELGDDPSRWRTAARTRRIELGLIAQCDATWVVSPAEKALLAKEAPDARIDIVSNIHEAVGPGPDFAQRDGLLFVGSYRHPPNVDAARWLVDEILPRVRAQLPDATLNLVGGDAPAEVLALGKHDGVVFHGYVPDLRPLLDGARVALAPLRYGAGVKGKVNLSLAHGQPVVATTCAVEGMHLVNGEDVLVADDAAAFAAAVVRLYGDPVLWRRLADGGLENTRRHFSVDAARATLRALLSSL